jgi:hypothetical protein
MGKKLAKMEKVLSSGFGRDVTRYVSVLPIKAYDPPVKNSQWRSRVDPVADMAEAKF